VPNFEKVTAGATLPDMKPERRLLPIASVAWARRRSRRFWFSQSAAEKAIELRQNGRAFARPFHHGG
jgi:hypothetical protein